ncbi:cytochrome C biogenesis protein [Lysobacteraceae bacterium NML08-0793]|nr:cytochrome C biogenesis protein [Xanthomonadaceae bacterium NML08-0793]
MGAFLLSVSVLSLLVLFAVLRPLLARSPALAACFATVSILASGALYWQLGTPAALDPAMLRAPQNMAEARAQLQARLRINPESVEDWRLLARTYAAEERFAEAAQAHERAVALAPEDADVLAEAAIVATRARADLRFDQTAIARLRQALAINPDHQQARWYLGISQRQAGQAAEAAETWQPLLKLVKDDNAREGILTQINQARAEAGLAALTLPNAEENPGIDVEVTLSAALLRQLQAHPQAQIFVLARAADGSPMPLAVERHAVRSPLKLRLDDADSPMPTLKLSSQTQIVLLARISLNGTAQKAEGDIESAPVNLRLPAAQLQKIHLDI